MKKALLWLCPLVIVYCVASCGKTSQSNMYLDDEGIPFKGISPINDYTEIALDSTETAMLISEIDTCKKAAPKTDMVILIIPDIPATEDGELWNPDQLADTIIKKWKLDKYDSSAVLVLIFTKLNTQYITATKNIARKFTAKAKQFIIADGVYQHYQKGEYAAAIGYTIKNVYAVVNDTYPHTDKGLSKRTAFLCFVFAMIVILCTLIEIKKPKVGAICAMILIIATLYFAHCFSVKNSGIAYVLFLILVVVVIRLGNYFRPPKILK